MSTLDRPNPAPAGVIRQADFFNDIGRIWTYVRDDRPFGGADPPAALYFASHDRRQEQPPMLKG